jgi:GcrA cell cycle regulator
MDWSAEAIETLRVLWSEGHSTAEIGRRMGVSKNAVVGKAHRLNLPARPSPIRRDAEAGATPPARRIAPPRPLLPMRRLEQEPVPAPAPTAAPLPEPVQVVAPLVVAPVAIVPPPPPPAPTPSPVSVLRAFPTERPRSSARSCCWPLGEPGTAQFRFCGCDALAGKPYCPDHAAVAYVKARDRREDAA